MLAHVRIRVPNFKLNTTAHKQRKQKDEFVKYEKRCTWIRLWINYRIYNIMLYVDF